MSEPTLQQLQDARKIIDVLIERSTDKDDWERTRYVYNNAIEDAANFLMDLIPHNPLNASALNAATNEIRKWLFIPDRLIHE